MKFLKYLLFLLLIAIIGMAIYVAVQPNDFKVSESSIINAPRAVVFETIADSTTSDWSSFWKSSELLKKSEIYPNDSIVKNFSSGNIKNSEIKWVLTSNPNGSTSIDRTLKAERISFMTKAKYALFGNKTDKIQNIFNNDFQTLNTNVQKSMAVYTITVDGITDYGGGFYMYKTTSSTASNSSAARSKQFDEVASFMDRHNVSASGKPFTIFIERNTETGNVIMSNAIPVSERVLVAEDSEILCGYRDRTKAVKATLTGNYSNSNEAWKKANNYIIENNLETSELSPFEVYKNDSASLPNPADWVTEIYIPITDPTEVEQNQPL